MESKLKVGKSALIHQSVKVPPTEIHYSYIAMFSGFNVLSVLL